MVLSDSPTPQTEPQTGPALWSGGLSRGGLCWRDPVRRAARGHRAGGRCAPAWPWAAVRSSWISSSPHLATRVRHGFQQAVWKEFHSGSEGSRRQRSLTRGAWGLPGGACLSLAPPSGAWLSLKGCRSQAGLMALTDGQTQVVLSVSLSGPGVFTRAVCLCSLGPWSTVRQLSSGLLGCQHLPPWELPLGE